MHEVSIKDLKAGRSLLPSSVSGQMIQVDGFFHEPSPPVHQVAAGEEEKVPAAQIVSFFQADASGEISSQDVFATSELNVAGPLAYAAEPYENMSELIKEDGRAFYALGSSIYDLSYELFIYFWFVLLFGCLLAITLPMIEAIGFGVLLCLTLLGVFWKYSHSNAKKVQRSLHWHLRIENPAMAMKIEK